MKLFPVYNTFAISLVKGKGCYVYDNSGQSYLDLYGGHAVISVGHAHPTYVKGIRKQVGKLAYYSNSVELGLQKKLAKKLGKILGNKSGLIDYQLFLCNSGAEAVENAIKLASFHTGRQKVIAFEGAFHGRTHGAVAITDNDNIRAAVNTDDHVIRLPFNDAQKLEEAFIKHKGDIAAVIIEPIQGVNGVQVASQSFLQLVSKLCAANNTCFIADEVQSGYGRSGRFFSFQHADVHPHLITMAKGMGNGFPIGGVLIHPDIKAKSGMLGTTFGGNPLACAAAIAVLDIIKKEKLKKNSRQLGEYFIRRLSELESVIEVRGQGLMIGVDFDFPIAGLRKSLLMDYHIFTGNAKSKNTLRFLPPLNISRKEIDRALASLSEAISKYKKESQ